jgi:hypothetical protein
MSDSERNDAEAGPIGTLLTAFKERMRSPFFGALAIAWLLINWRAVLFLVLDDQAILTRIEYADKNFFSIWSMTWWPLCAAIAYVAISPWLGALLAVYRSMPETISEKNHLKTLKEIANTQREIDDPGGLLRQRDQLNEDITRQKEFLAKTQTLEAETKDRIATVEKQSLERLSDIHSDFERQGAARKQLDSDIQRLSVNKEAVIEEIQNLKDERDRIRLEVEADRNFPLQYLDLNSIVHVGQLLRDGGAAPLAIEAFLAGTVGNPDLVRRAMSAIAARSTLSGKKQKNAY